MMIGRFRHRHPGARAIAGSLAAKQLVPRVGGHVPDATTASSSPLLLGVIIITGGLIYFPADALGPFVEHLQMQAGLTVLRSCHATIDTTSIRPSPTGRACPPQARRRRYLLGDPDWPRRRIRSASSNPRTLARNPVMFVVEIVSASDHDPLVRDIIAGNGGASWLHGPDRRSGCGFTVPSSPISRRPWRKDAARPRRTALRRTRTETQAKRLGRGGLSGSYPEGLPRSTSKAGDPRCSSKAGDVIPSDGDVIEGIASVDDPPSPASRRPVIRE